MKWFKHQSDARNSLKLRKVRRKYGGDGYAIYWFCLEAIAYDVDKDNLTFDLKEDSETIGFELNIQEKRVEEIIRYMVEIGLFESSNNVITCLKLAESIDKSMTNSPKMRAWIGNKTLPTPSKGVMTHSDIASSCPELEVEEEVEEEIYKPIVQPEAKPSKFKYNVDQMNFAIAMYQSILNVAPAAKKPNLDAWANTARLINEIDGINLMDAWNVFAWANSDPFWQTNILSADKFRKQYAQLSAKMSSNSTGSRRDIMQESANSNWHEGDLGL
tara:strand:+ start:68 stop:886 length:819 start_codon:yes stop_codon:yes gene_type:complete